LIRRDGDKAELRISNCETGNPPEGWESEGQFRDFNSMLYALCSMLFHNGSASGGTIDITFVHFVVKT
jgi:hypothetical protein